MAATLFGQKATILKLQAELDTYRAIDENWNVPRFKKARERASSMSTHDLLVWEEKAIIDVEKAFDDVRATRESQARREILTDLADSLMDFQAVVGELLSRES